MHYGYNLNTFIFFEHIVKILSGNLSIKSGFIWNDFKKMGYLGKEVYNTPACSFL